MKERSIKELLVILRNYIKKNRDPDKPDEMMSGGLCTIILSLNCSTFTGLEKRRLLIYLEDNIPKSVKSKNSYWWKQYKIKPRLQWLTRQINKL